MSVVVAAGAAGRAEARPRTVLIVDHRDSIRRVLSLILASEGLESVSTDEPDEAMSLARQLVPDAVTVELGQADGQGVAVLRRLKADPLLRHVPVVALVSCQTARDLAREYGASAVLNTPVDLDEVLERIQSVTR